MVAGAAMASSADAVSSMAGITMASNMATKATALMNLSQSLTSAVASMAKGMGSNVKDAARPS